MTGMAFTFDSDADYCTIDTYKFECTDPYGDTSSVTYSPLDGGFSTNYVGVHCSKFDTSALASRTISASAISGGVNMFTEDNDGDYELKLTAWMYINTGLQSLTNEITWTRRIQANCLSSANVISSIEE